MTVADCLFGVETEYAVAMLARDRSPVAGDGGDPGEGLAMRMLRLADATMPSLPDGTSRGLFLQNGGRFYIDAGAHPEFSTPECGHPSDVVRYVHAGNSILRNLAGTVAGQNPQVAEALVLRCNVDYSGSGSSWGMHESYLHRSHGEDLPGQLIPHLVSRIVYTGAGGFNNLQPRVLEFTLSPRAFHMVRSVSDESTCQRGIYHTKDEPLAKGGFHRLHVIFGESLCSEIALWLKVGTTALVVAMIDAGLQPGRNVQLANPLAALRHFAADPTCRATAPCQNGRTHSAIDIQRRYLETAEQQLGAAFMPSWAPEVCREWRAMLDRLDAAPDAVATQLDWAIKLTLYRDRIEEHGFTEAQVEAWNRALRQPRQTHRLDREDIFPSDSAPPAQAGEDAATDAEKLCRHGLDSRDRPRFEALRDSLFELDARFGELGNGVFTALDDAGVLEHRRVEAAEIDRAVQSPPSGGRAALRGDHVRLLQSDRLRYRCNWDAILDQHELRSLDLGDPFARMTQWRALECSEPIDLDQSVGARTRAVVRHARLLHSRGQYSQALSALDRENAPTDDCGSPLRIHLLQATGRQALGEVGAAARLLTALAEEAQAAPEIDTWLIARWHLVLGDLARAMPRRALLQSITAIGRACDGTEAAPYAAWPKLVRSRVELACGQFETALDLAANALLQSSTARDGLDSDLCHLTILACMLALDRLEAADSHIHSGSNHPSSHRRQALFDAVDAEIHRRLGDERLAVRSARTALRRSRSNENAAERVFILGLVATTLIETGHLREADSVVESLQAYRIGEVVEFRFAVETLCGDFNLAQARQLGKPDEDGQLSIDFCERGAASWFANCAGGHYRNAHRLGRQLDRQLCCNWRSEQTRARQAEQRLALQAAQP